MIDKGIKFLQKNKSFDSAVSTSVYNMWSPLRARKLDKSGALKPFVPFKVFGTPNGSSPGKRCVSNFFFEEIYTK